MADVKEKDLMKEILVAVIGSLIVGIAASFLTIKYNEGATVTWRQSIESQITSMKVIMQAVQANQIELASRGAWMVHVDKDLNTVERRLNSIESSRFTKEDADSTTRRLDREIELLWEKVDSEG